MQTERTIPMKIKIKKKPRDKIFRLFSNKTILQIRNKKNFVK